MPSVRGGSSAKVCLIINFVWNNRVLIYFVLQRKTTVDFLIEAPLADQNDLSPEQKLSHKRQRIERDDDR